MKKTYLVTGCAGFIGCHLTLKLIKKNFHVLGLDSLNNYYSPKIKKDRLKKLLTYKSNFNFFKINLCDKKKLENFSKRNKKINAIIHLAAHTYK